MNEKALFGAELLVSLTSSDDKKATVSAALARKATQEIAEATAHQVGSLWDNASKEALSFLSQVLKNNPGKTKGQIFARPDVQQALRHPFEVAAKESENLIRLAWKTSEKDSVQKVKGELKLLGESWKGYQTNEALLNAIVGDLHKNATAMRVRFGKAVDGDKETVGDRLKAVASDARLRSRYSAQQAVWGVATQVRDSAFSKAELNKMWLARVDDPDCCKHCRELHRKVVGPGEQFPISEGLKVYRGVLYGPPRHPNCRCVVVATKRKKNVFKS